MIGFEAGIGRLCGGQLRWVHVEENAGVRWGSVGELLLEHWGTDDDVRRLIAFGDMVRLGSSSETSVFWDRDGGQESLGWVLGCDEFTWRSRAWGGWQGWAEFWDVRGPDWLYVWDGSRWWVSERGENWHRLDARVALADDRARMGDGR
jgi:hypothetical protein